eukprot:scaffold31926_cov32-Tisochrysis_lutea.AAC.3
MVDHSAWAMTRKIQIVRMAAERRDTYVHQDISYGTCSSAACRRRPTAKLPSCGLLELAHGKHLACIKVQPVHATPWPIFIPK